LQALTLLRVRWKNRSSTSPTSGASNAVNSSAVQAVASRFEPFDFALESRMVRETPPKADPFFPDIETHLLGAHSEDIGGIDERWNEPGNDDRMYAFFDRYFY
jgi:hypothetical protein